SFDAKCREVVPVGVEAFDFVNAEKRLFGLTENIAATSKESIELDERIDEGFVYEHRLSNSNGRDMLKDWIMCPLQSLAEVSERQTAVTYLAMDMHSKLLEEMCVVLSKVKSIKVACLRIQTELLLADLESLAQFAYAIVKLHGLVTSMSTAPMLIKAVSAIKHNVCKH
ncbi:hypothetical protein GGI08_005372, partial [Coemansia sp. S2]